MLKTLGSENRMCICRSNNARKTTASSAILSSLVTELRRFNLLKVIAASGKKENRKQETANRKFLT